MLDHFQRGARRSARYRFGSADRVYDDYRVRIPTFEGPLDLLLHLIRKDQLNIYDIPIATICKISAHIALLNDVDMNLAGEFMVMAATLTYFEVADADAAKRSAELAKQTIRGFRSYSSFWSTKSINARRRF